MYAFLKAHWVAGAATAAAALALTAPILYGAAPLGVWLIFLHSPGYMIHQVEEHAGDCFRAFVNARLFGGREALTTFDVLWVNVGVVWGLDFAALYVAWLAGPGWALAAPYLMLVNALSHIATAVRFSGYNPGVVTSVAIFLPLGFAALWAIPATLLQQAVGLGVSLAVHAVIVLRISGRARALLAAAA